MKKLSYKEKKQRAAEYKAIRKAWKKTDGRLTYKQFKKRVLLKKEAHSLSTKEAIKKELNTETYVSAAERSRHNLIQSIKEKHRAEYDELRELSRVNGKYAKIADNLEWDKDRGAYVLRVDSGEYLIDVSNSPEEVYITDLSEVF